MWMIFMISFQFFEFVITFFLFFPFFIFPIFLCKSLATGEGHRRGQPLPMANALARPHLWLAIDGGKKKEKEMKMRKKLRKFKNCKNYPHQLAIPRRIVDIDWTVVSAISGQNWLGCSNWQIIKGFRTKLAKLNNL